MTTPADIQLKQTLAKMLPEKLKLDEQWSASGLRYKDSCKEVLDTELLHLCWLVEETLTMGQRLDYLNHLDNWKDDDWLTCHATWQQRVIALAKVKGIEIL